MPTRWYTDFKTKAVYDSIQEGLLLFNVEGKILFANTAASQILQITKKELTNNSVDFLLEIVENFNDKPYKKSSSVFYNVVKTGKAIKGMKVTIKSGKKFRVLLVNSGPVFGEDGKMEGVVSTFSDITKQTREQEQQQMFIKLVGHELKQPLSLIKAYSYYMQKSLEKSSQKISQYPQKINRQVKTVTQMLNDIVDTSRISIKSLTIKKKADDILSLVAAAVSDVSAAHPQRKITFKTATKEPYKIMIDANRIKQVVSNLLNNAIKYSEEKSTIEVKLKKLENSTIISVKDQGIGITAEELDAIFTPYFRSKNNHLNAKGLGLGLSIVEEIVHNHGGSIKVSSKPKKGSTFTVELPHN